MNTENNKLIAEFMGWLHSSDAFIDSMEMGNLKYDTSWDWLMPVMHKVIKFKQANHSKVKGELEEQIIFFKNACVCNDIGLAYAQVVDCVQFIQWYNQNQKQ